MMLGNLSYVWGRGGLDAYFTYTKQNSKQIKDLTLKMDLEIFRTHYKRRSVWPKGFLSKKALTTKK